MTELRTKWEGNDAEFLLWVASWFDLIDPILQVMFSKAGVLPEADREKMVAWLEGNDVQDRLREIAEMQS